ncbi:hypothetical protein [Qipengyuania sp.]|uniref:hypothetical protein n=1 Tax=Qipengyuania sp. TaxID=2004515 RepID=UPI003AF68379
MAELFASGHAVDIVLLVLAIEAIWLSRRGWPWSDIATTLLPAALILLGTRAALVGASWIWIATPLALSFPVHLADLKRRGGSRRDPS